MLMFSTLPNLSSSSRFYRVFRATKVKALTIRITRIADRWDFLRHLGSALLAVDGMMQSVAAIRLEAPYTFTSGDIDTLYIPAVAACISFVHNMPDHGKS